MFNQEMLKMWSEAHVFYDMYLQKRTENDLSNCDQREIDWRERLLGMPNGKLLIDNQMFREIAHSKKMYILHATTKLDIILESGTLYSSAGCLVGSIYSTPITLLDNESFRLHNLGDFIVNEEARKSISLREDKPNLDLLIIEISRDQSRNPSLIGIDYTRLGKIHFEIYEGLKYLLSGSESFELESIVIGKIKNAIGDLASLCNLQNRTLSNEEFYKTIESLVYKLPMVGYLYFEALSEYVMLNGQSDVYKESFDKGEFYNFDYKDFMFTTYEDLLKSFNLGLFSPSEKQIESYFTKSRGFDIEDLKESVKERLTFFIMSKLFSTNDIDWFNIKWNYNNLENIGFKPLIGHLVHRELRNFNRYQDFYFYFDQLKALQIWNYWNHMGIQLPFNGVIPKGELGINPAYPNLEYKIYHGMMNKEGCVDRGRELELDIVPRLVDLKNTFMRVKNNNLK